MSLVLPSSLSTIIGCYLSLMAIAIGDRRCANGQKDFSRHHIQGSVCIQWIQESQILADVDEGGSGDDASHTLMGGR